MDELELGLSGDDGSTITENVVSALARVDDVSPTGMEPLHEVVDPDALDQLFEPTATSPRMVGQVTFSYRGYDVTAHADGDVEVTAREE